MTVAWLQARFVPDLNWNHGHIMLLTFVTCLFPVSGLTLVPDETIRAHANGNQRIEIH